MPEKTKPQDNFDRLLKHLKEGSLAAQLVQAYRDSDAANPLDSMKTILRSRLEQARKDLEDTKT